MNIFKHVAGPLKPKRSTFNLDHEVKLTTNFGVATPIMCEEVIPGDTWQLKSNILVRFAPLIAPVMHDISVYTHYFYVPYRLLWDSFEDFITGGELGEFVTPEQEPEWPRLMMKVHGADPNGQFAVGSLADYLNYPTSDSNITGHMYVSAMPFRAYQMIWNEYFRDENLQEKLDIKTTSGIIQEDSDEYNMLLTLRNRAWAKDYFTSALPWPMKGDQQNVPVMGVGELQGDRRIPTTPMTSVIGDEVHAVIGNQEINVGNLTAGDTLAASGDFDIISSSDRIVSPGTPINIKHNSYIDPISYDGVPVNLNGLEFTIADLRRASAIQRWMERNARGGTRYIESLLSHFGVVSDDLRLQRPEFLGGGRTPVVVSDVLQTSESTSSSPQAQYAGVGFSFGKKNAFKRTFKERGVIIGIMTIMPKPAYSEGLPIAYHKFNKFQHYWPEFARLGEQEISNFELALRGNDLYGTFGYTPRYAEYKYIPSRVHGEFKTTLGFWNLNRHYSSQPNLTGEFIECNAENNDLNRIFAVTEHTEDHLFVQIKHDIKARRPMPYLPDPSLS